MNKHLKAAMIIILLLLVIAALFIPVTLGIMESRHIVPRAFIAAWGVFIVLAAILITYIFANVVRCIYEKKTKPEVVIPPMVIESMLRAAEKGFRISARGKAVLAWHKYNVDRPNNTVNIFRALKRCGYLTVINQTNDGELHSYYVLTENL